MRSPEMEEIKKIIRRKVENAKQECFKLANPEGLKYDQLSSSERVLYDFCYYLDGYDPNLLDRLIEIINETFYG